MRDTEIHPLKAIRDDTRRKHDLRNQGFSDVLPSDHLLSDSHAINLRKSTSLFDHQSDQWLHTELGAPLINGVAPLKRRLVGKVLATPD
jgi:hypothetical protein